MNVLSEANEPAMHPSAWVQGEVELDDMDAALCELLRRPLTWLTQTPDAAVDSIRNADVVIVPDIHNIPAISMSFADLLPLIRWADDGRGQRPLGLAFEYLSGDEADALNAAGDDREGLLTELAVDRPRWPLRGADRIDARVRQLGASYVGLRTPKLLGHRRTASDEEGGLVIVDGREYYRNEMRRFRRTADREYARVISNWCKQSGGKVVALVGNGHCLKSDLLLGTLRSEGLRVVLLAPFLPSWELTLWERFGPAGATEWLEPLKGVLRPPTKALEYMVSNPPKREPSEALPRPPAWDSVASGLYAQEEHQILQGLETLKDGLSGLVGSSSLPWRQRMGRFRPRVFSLARSSKIPWRVRRSAICAVSYLGGKRDSDAIAQLLALMQSEDVLVRRVSAVSLAQKDVRMPHAREGLLEALRHACESTERELRAQIALALGAWLLDPEVVVPVLAESIGNTALPIDLRVRMIHTLGYYGLEAMAFRGDIRALEKQASGRVKSACAAALRRLREVAR